MFLSNNHNDAPTKQEKYETKKKIQTLKALELEPMLISMYLWGKGSS